MGKREHSKSDLYFPKAGSSTFLMAAHKNSRTVQDSANSQWA